MSHGLGVLEIGNGIEDTGLWWDTGTWMVGGV